MFVVRKTMWNDANANFIFKISRICKNIKVFIARPKITGKKANTIYFPTLIFKILNR